jgi:hypothetical protein
MTFTISGAVCKLVAEYRTLKNGCRINERFRSDSEVFFKLRKLMRGQGYDVVKRNMEQDGHLMGDKHTYYIRQRYWKFAIYDPDYAIRSLHDQLTKRGIAHLAFERWETAPYDGSVVHGKRLTA